MRGRILSTSEEIEREKRLELLRKDSETAKPKRLEERVEYLEEAHLDAVDHNIHVLARLERNEEAVREATRSADVVQHEMRSLARGAVSAVGDAEKRINAELKKVSSRQWKPRDWILVFAAIASAVTSIIGALAHH